MTSVNHSDLSPSRKPGRDGDPEYGTWKYEKEDQPKHKPGKHQMVIEEKHIDTSKFDMIYRRLGSKLVPEARRIDYVLVHPVVNVKEIEDADERTEVERKNKLRERFVQALKKQGLLKQTETLGDNVYTKLHCPFKRLCQEAEAVSLELPLANCESENKDDGGMCSSFWSWIDRTFATDDEVDMVSAPFKMDRVNLYENYDNPTKLFRPSVRSLLVEHMLINIDLRKQKMDKGDDGLTRPFRHANADEKTVMNCWGCLNKDDQQLGDLQKVGLDYMFVEGVYTNRFILHEETNYKSGNKSGNNKTSPEAERKLDSDPRLDMQNSWVRFFKFQPLWKIRNYFGEKIAFYFAWSGTLITTLWIPMLFGFAIFLYGLVKSVSRTLSNESSANATSQLTDLFASVKESFDNEITPFYAMVLCIWGTIFLEVWKRKQATLAYQWDVEQFEENEPDRPEFYGTKPRLDPVTHVSDWYYPFSRRVWKILVSSMTVVFMVCLVFASVLAVIVYRVIATVDYCPDLPDSECMMLTTILSSLFNAISILILGTVYNFVARKLTNWENHRTQTKYNDALIIKLFAFQFANNYASCLYIAFFRGRFDDYGILNRGSDYQDDCEGTCMSQLSFQVLILMITKPIPKLLTDLVLPWAKSVFIKRCQCCNCIPFLRRFLKFDPRSDSEKTLLEIESVKPSLGNFTLGEYTEKVIQYGLMMLFAASCPLAPFLALCFNLIDIRTDAWRMLWWYQRPMAIIAEDIGTWYTILTFLNFCGVVSNAFLIAFTSSWGANYDTVGKLWIVIGFEHIVFALKFLLAYLIPDVPAGVALAIRKKQYQLQVKLEEQELKDSEDVAVMSHYPTNYRPPREKVYVETEDRRPGNDSMYLNREDTRATSPWRRTGKPRPEEDGTEENTDVRRMKKKKKQPILHKDEYDGDAVEASHRGDLITTPDYSGRAPTLERSRRDKAFYDEHFGL